MVKARALIAECGKLRDVLKREDLSKTRKSNPRRAAAFQIQLRDAVDDILNTFKDLTTTDAEIDVLADHLKFFRRKQAELGS